MSCWYCFVHPSHILRVCVCRNGLVTDLGGLASHRGGLAVDIPVELLRYVDEGGNPDVFTSEIFQRANRSNQLAKGKVEAFAAFR